MSLLSISTLLAQDAKSQFEQFKSQSENEFERTRQQQDSLFARAIVDNWRAINLKEPVQKESEPKPEEQPEAEPSYELEDLEHKFIDTQPKLMRSFKPASTQAKDEVEPDLEKMFDFYGEQIRVRYSSQLLRANDLNTRNQHDLANAWRALSKLPYQSVIRTLIDKRDVLQLPDYGYLMLLDSFLSTLDLSESGEELCKWFLLNKSGYMARIGLIEGYPVLIIGSFGKIYKKRYYSSAGLNFYIISDLKGTLESYIIESDADNNPFEFSIANEIRLPLEPAEKIIKYTSKSGSVVDLKIYRNQNVVDMVANFPQVELAYYLSSQSSDLLARSIKTSISPYLVEKSEIEKVNFLLEFVQKGFAYQADSRQFGREQVMFPEELFSYQFSDCDDRVVLLSYLLRMFVDIPVIGVGFPQHVALGLKLTSPVSGESIKYNGYVFTFCDPTYLNAPLGSIIPTANRNEIKIIEF